MLRPIPLRAFVLLAAVLILAPSRGVTQAAPQDWPGLWGPERRGSLDVDGVRPPRAFTRLWRRPATGGYSEVVAAEGRVFTLDARDGSDHVVAMDGQTGREQWRFRLGPTYRGHGGSHDGPISTPAVQGRELYAVGPHGVLVAIDAVTGTERWRHDLVQAFGAAAPTWGFAVSPLVEGQLVVIQTGGEKSQGLLAFERASGRLAWSAPHAKSRSYSSAVAATIAGTRQIVAAAGDRIFAVSPEDGRQLWSVAGPGAQEEINNSPIVLPDDRVLLTFWGEAVMLKVAAQNGVLTASELWRSPRLRGSHGPTIYRDHFLYGFSGAMLLCLDAKTGDVRWRQRTEEGSLIGLGQNLLMLGRSTGNLHVIRASPDGFSELVRTAVLTPGAFSITGPSVANGRVYIRNLEEIAAFQLER